MKHYLLTLIFIVMFIFSCKGAEESTSPTPTPQAITIPEDAIPFDFDSHIYFDVLIDDTTHATLAFDTGNTGLLLDKKFYNDVFGSYRTLRNAMVRGAGNQIKRATLDMNPWKYRIGEYSRNEDMALILDICSILGDKADGLLGMNLVKDSIVEISYDDSYMRFLPSDYAIDDTYTHIPCSFLDDEHNRLIMPVRITIDDNTVIDGRFLLDTGAGAGIIIGYETSSKYQLSEKLTNAKSTHLVNGGVGGERIDNVSRIKEIEIGGHKTNDEIIYFSTDDRGAISDTRYDGIIGNAILKRYDIIINLSSGDMYIRPSSYFSIPSPKYSTGLILTPRGKSYNAWVVNGVTEDCNAQKAGIKNSDMILSINGKNINEIDDKTLENMSHNAERWTVKILRGKDEIEISFEKDVL